MEEGLDRTSGLSGGGRATQRRLSVLASFRGYQMDWLRPDISAGLAIAAVGIPSAIAYPAIAGLPPETGIYASIASVIGYALFGPSRRLIVGPDAPTMAVLAGVIATVLAGMPDATAADRATVAALIAHGRRAYLPDRQLPCGLATWRASCRARSLSASSSAWRSRSSSARSAA